MNENLNNVLAALTQKLGTTVENLWPLLVRHELIDAIVGLLTGLAITAVAPYLSLLCFREAQKKKNALDGKELWNLPGALLVLASFGGFIGAMCCIADILVPQAAAVHAILGH